MKVFNFYIFDRSGNCLFYSEWGNERSKVRSEEDKAENCKLVFGMLFSLKGLTEKMSPAGDADELRMIKTNSFTLHHYETGTGLLFVLNTDVAAPSQNRRLEHIYKNIYIEFVCKSPLYKNGPPSSTIESKIFSQRLESFLFTEAK